MRYNLTTYSASGTCVLTQNTICFTAHTTDEQFFQMEFDFPDWEADTFVFMPACAYNGNRFKKVNRPYPPQFLPEECGVNAEPLINRLPAMNPDGSGKLEVTAGDMAVPCVGLFYPHQKKALFLYTQQQVKEKNIGFTAEAGRLTVSFPARRMVAYRFLHEDALAPDSGIFMEQGEQVQSTFRILQADCADFADFYAFFFRTRKQFLPARPLENLYTLQLWELLRDNKLAAWKKKSLISGSDWRCGGFLDGAEMELLPLLLMEKEKTADLICTALDFETLPEHLGASGFFYGSVKDGIPKSDKHFIRLSAGTLYFLLKMFDHLQPKEQWVKAARKCADAFVTLYCTYGKFGRTINPETGELLIGCGFAGVGAISALVKCAAYFQNDIYREIACSAGEYYYKEFAKHGYTNGGPSDILCAPDSESAFLLLEGLVNLYELTGESRWLSRAQHCLYYCSSWVVSYSYRFPESSEFARLNVNTVGSVFASIQNKHSAPGICVLSGDSIYKLYKYTGNADYLELIKDIAYFIPQCVATKERPIIAKAEDPYFNYLADVPLKEGTINERVNMSDWEDASGVGNVISAPNWPENSLLLSYAELMHLKEFKQ